MSETSDKRRAGAGRRAKNPRASLKDAVARLRAMPKPPSVEIREPIEMPDREWD
jgi:hypothetical protein